MPREVGGSQQTYKGKASSSSSRPNQQVTILRGNVILKASVPRPTRWVRPKHWTVKPADTNDEVLLAALNSQTKKAALNSLLARSRQHSFEMHCQSDARTEFS